MHFVEPGYLVEQKGCEVKTIIVQHLKKLILQFGLAFFLIREPYGGLSDGGGGRKSRT